MDEYRYFKTYYTVGFAVPWVCLAIDKAPSIGGLCEALKLNHTMKELVGWEIQISVS